MVCLVLTKNSTASDREKVSLKKELRYGDYSYLRFLFPFFWSHYWVSRAITVNRYTSSPIIRTGTWWGRSQSMKRVTYLLFIYDPTQLQFSHGLEDGNCSDNRTFENHRDSDLLHGTFRADFECGMDGIFILKNATTNTETLPWRWILRKRKLSTPGSINGPGL